MSKSKVEDKKVSDLIPDSQNVNVHSQRGRGIVEHSVRRYGIGRGIVAAGKGTDTPQIIGGHLTTEIVGSLDMDDVIFVHTNGEKLVVTVRDDIAPNSVEAIALGLIDNESQKQSYNPDLDILAAVMADPAMQALKDEDKILAGIVEGMGLPQEGGGGQEEPRKTLAERFGVPPFSVLDARQGYWQDRKRAWIALGLKGELGRGDNALDMSATMAGITDENEREICSKSRRESPKHKFSGALKDSEEFPDTLASKRIYDGKQQSHLGKTFNMGMGANKENGWKQEDSLGSGTSIFDPVLSELLYRWFMPIGGHVLNPMSGEATHGIVAGYLGYKFTGVELRDEQAESNREQARKIGVDPVWITADALTIDTLDIAPADFVVSCPPYADLEVYSDNPLDISTMDYPDFIRIYSEIIRKSCDKLKDDRFAAFVVGEVRDSKGIYYDFVGDTIKAFKAAGLKYYNEMILVTSVGSLPIRAGRQFESGRKIGKTHQNVLVFLKGDSKRAVQACGKIEMELPDGFELNQDD